MSGLVEVVLSRFFENLQITETQFSVENSPFKLDGLTDNVLDEDADEIREAIEEMMNEYQN